MNTRRIAAAVLFAFLPATVSLPAVAQPADDASTVQARARFKEGVDAFDKGKYEEARLAFLQAYTLKKHPAVLLNLAQSSAKSNHPLEAAKYFNQFLKEATTATPQQRKDAESGLAEVRQKLGRIEVVAPAGTDVSLDDQGKVGTTPMEAIDVEPGSHTVKSPTQSVTVSASAGQKVEAKLVGGGGAAGAPPVAPAPAPSTDPATPPAGENPPQAEQPKTTSKSTQLETKAPIYIGLGVAGLGIVSAIIFAAFKADAQSKADSVAAEIRRAAATRGLPAQGACNAGITDFNQACSTLRNNNDKVDTNATIANVSLVVAGVGLVVAGVWWLAGPRKEEATTAGRLVPKLTPYATWNGGGGMLTGEF